MQAGYIPNLKFNPHFNHKHYMLKNYFKIAFRNAIHHKTFALINLSGLTIGLTCSILILLWVRNELSYDKFHAHAGQIYRITCQVESFKAAINPAGMPWGLKSQLPVIKNVARITQPYTILFEVKDQKFVENRTFYVDSTFFEVFSYPLMRGDRKTALMNPTGILITERMAKKYFGNEDPIGKTVKKDEGEVVTVTGVLADAPANSHFQYDVIMPMSAIFHRDNDLKNNVWDNFDFYSFLQLDKTFLPTDASIQALEGEIDEIYKIRVKELRVNFHLQPLTDIHLHSNYQIDFPGHGNIQYVKIFFIVALFILAVACINFMNLATARSARRAREVGLRKVVGAERGQLIVQFLSESILISFLALALSIVAVILLLPVFNTISGKSLTIGILSGNFFMQLIGIALVTGLVSGLYPALYLSGFQPVKVLKGNIRSLGKNVNFRNGLVVVQFIVSIVLLAGTAVVYKQLNFIRERNLGFEKDNLLYIHMAGAMWNKQDALKSELKRNPLTTEFTIVSELPINLTSGSVDVGWEGKNPNDQPVIITMDVNEDFIGVFRMKILAGRGFSSEFKSDTHNFVINETAMKLMGMTLDQAVGKSILWDKKPRTIVGVVQDFNFKPIQQPIEPLVLRLNRWGGTVIVRANPAATEATIAALEKISVMLNPQFPFTYNFLDRDLDNLYKGEQKMGALFNLFSVLGIFISCLGLFGLSAFMAEQRTKEIGVRKVLGASVFNIVYLLGANYTRLVAVAIVLSIPIAWFAANSWLQSFAYRIELNGWIFVFSAGVAVIIAWLTVSFETIKAAVVNPIRSLKSE